MVPAAARKVVITLDDISELDHFISTIVEATYTKRKNHPNPASGSDWKSTREARENPNRKPIATVSILLTRL